jgi:hypothetical protein
VALAVVCNVNPAVTVDGGKFVTEAVGNEPTLPLTVVPLPAEPVTAELPSKANCAAVPSEGAT